jgi:hypothetical protein
MLTQAAVGECRSADGFDTDSYVAIDPFLEPLFIFLVGLPTTLGSAAGSAVSSSGRLRGEDIDGCSCSGQDAGELTQLDAERSADDQASFTSDEDDLRVTPTEMDEAVTKSAADRERSVEERVTSGVTR